MNRILCKLLGRFKQSADKDEDKDDVLVEDEKIPEGPYILSSIFYLFVIIFIGIPMWFHTCSVTRYPLPDLSKLGDKILNGPTFKLNLDISVIQLTRQDKTLTDQLRADLPSQLNISIDTPQIRQFTYDLSWRVRRPTKEEDEIFQLHQRKYNFSSEALVELEEKLINIHKPTNRFRLFLYLIDEPYHSSFCPRLSQSTFTASFERFIYLCSSKHSSDIVTQIKDVLGEIYVDTVDLANSKNILATQLDILFSLLPESQSNTEHMRLIKLADKIHHLYDKNIKLKFQELKELANLRLITQNVYDLLNFKQISKLLLNDNKKENHSNETTTQPRILKTDRVGQIFHNLESRISKSSSQHVQNVIYIQSDLSKAPFIFQKGSSTSNIIEGQDLNFMFLANDDKSLVLALRSLIRRIVGLRSSNLCKSCLVRRDVFLNRWEIDAIMGALTVTKLHKTYQSLRSISQQVVGVKIPKEVSELAREAHNNALDSLKHLETKQLLESYRLASRAYEMSEAAFYDPSLLESLYFPDDLKYAIYLPLFLPMSLPLFMSVIRVLRHAYKRYFTKSLNPKVKIN